MATIAQSPFLFDDLDDDSADLILQLQLHDLEEFKQSRAGKQREGSGSDAEIAAGLLEESLGDLRTFLADRRMTKSIARAVQADGTILTQNALAEEAALEDHALAHRLNGTNIDSEVKIPSKSIDDTTLSKLAGLYVSEALGQTLANCHIGPDLVQGADEEPETSTRAAMRRDTRDGNLNRHCEACREPKKYFDVVAAPCNHEYCRDCLRDLFDASLTDESLFPPRCCRQSIPLDAVSIFLTSELKREFQQKEVEFSTPNRTYCSRTECSLFISAENIVDEIANCPSCAARTYAAAGTNFATSVEHAGRRVHVFNGTKTAF
ncbi:hypothetical protein AYL99_01996 [Fonsecaea erecta]|uniref:RING-type domain-containing protein n=1 Tax=Fonsecaea erecta TaxID=1367422 RepID=A0A178ZSH0_9EURO|nr:hypothetical protein AYL99_01996 [Fonsecaea erecta]OAP62769.1 hypothetical protein AYL99_01996 [Fonsecaea erecta]